MDKQKLLLMTAQIKSIVSEMALDLDSEQAKPIPTAGFTKAKLAMVAEREAQKNLVWSPGAEATKFTKPFESWFGPARFSWCAAFVTWCCEESGLSLGIQPNPKIKGFEQYTWALVETWQKWGQSKNCYFDNDGVFIPLPGDIVIFDWQQKDIHSPDNRWQDHIGINLAKTSSATYKCAEGNHNNQTSVTSRPSVCIQGWVSIPDGLVTA